MVQNNTYQTVNSATISFLIKENYRGLMATCRYAVIIFLNFHDFLLFRLILKIAQLEREHVAFLSAVIKIRNAQCSTGER